MTLVACPPMYLPEMNWWGGNPGPVVVSTLLDAAADRCAAVFRAPKTGNILKIELRFGTVPVLTTADLIIGLQDVSLTTGDPDGTFDQSVVIATGSIAANTTFKATLGAARAVTKNDRVAVVVQFNTFVALDNLNINRITQAASQGPFYYEYPDVNTAGAYAKAVASFGMFSIEYDDGTYAYIPSLPPVITAGTVAFNNTSTPDAIGLRFQVPFPCTLGGAHLSVDADGDFDLILYSAAGATTVYSSDKDVRSATTGMVSPVMFNAEQTLAANTTYVLAVEPSSATNVTLNFYDVSGAAVLDQWGGGQQLHYATAKNPATTADFTMTTTRRPIMGLIITAVDDGAQTRAAQLVNSGALVG